METDRYCKIHTFPLSITLNVKRLASDLGMTLSSAAVIRVMMMVVVMVVDVAAIATSCAVT